MTGMMPAMTILIIFRSLNLNCGWSCTAHESNTLDTLVPQRGPTPAGPGSQAAAGRKTFDMSGARV